MNKTNKAWEVVLLSRDTERPQTSDYIKAIFENFIELKGDRKFSNDNAILAGIATINNTAVTIIGQEKGRNIKDFVKYRNGMVLPDGYRKALRLMKQAEKFGRPVICFIDTPAAHSFVESEERGQSQAIADNLLNMALLKTPILSIVISQGGSGGALALGVANEVWVLENAYYSILPPEGFATILWKDVKRAPEAAEVMKSTAKELLEFGIINKVFKEPKGGIQSNPIPVYIELKKEIIKFVHKNKPGIATSKKRIAKYRNIGKFKVIKK